MDSRSGKHLLGGFDTVLAWNRRNCIINQTYFDMQSAGSWPSSLLKKSPLVDFR